MKPHTKQSGIVFFSITLLIVGHLILLGNHPGLYFDAVNPDYVGVQWLFPQTTQTSWMIAPPWLTQIYHGSNGIFITMLSVLIAGTTSVLQYHITYGIVASVAVFLVYQVLIHKRIGIPAAWAALAALVLASLPSLLTIIISQYYMCLFGSVCILSGTLLFLDWLDDVSDWKRIGGCFLLFGVAFYSYFNFLFFLPSLLLATIYALKRAGKLSFDAVVLPLMAYLLGCGLYVVGWSQIALRASGLKISAARAMLLCISIYAAFLLVDLAFWRKWKLRILLLGVYAIGGIVWLLWVMPSIGAIATDLGVVQSASLLQRISSVFTDYSNILSGRGTEAMIFGKTVTLLNRYVLHAFFALALITLILELMSRKRMLAWKIALGMDALYLLCCVAFGTRMQTQHYVPLVFLTCICTCLCIKSMMNSLTGLRCGRGFAGHRRILLKTAAGLVILLNLLNTAKVINAIRVTGGEGFWASEINELAAQALDSKAQGKKELYVFADWGFFTGFDYLTMNRIPFVVSMDQEFLARAYAEGYDLVACYWSHDDTLLYEELFAAIGNGTGKTVSKEWIDSNGRVEFYALTLSGRGEE